MPLFYLWCVSLIIHEIFKTPYAVSLFYFENTAAIKTTSTTSWIKNEVITHKGWGQHTGHSKLICSHSGFTLKFLLCTVNYKIVHGVRAWHGTELCSQWSLTCNLKITRLCEPDWLPHLSPGKLYSSQVVPSFSPHFPRFFFSPDLINSVLSSLFIVLNYTRKTSNKSYFI